VSLAVVSRSLSLSLPPLIPTLSLSHPPSLFPSLWSRGHLVPSLIPFPLPPAPPAREIRLDSRFSLSDSFSPSLLPSFSAAPPLNPRPFSLSTYTQRVTRLISINNPQRIFASTLSFLPLASISPPLGAPAAACALSGPSSILNSSSSCRFPEDYDTQGLGSGNEFMWK
jgi:hypothetical protein